MDVYKIITESPQIIAEGIKRKKEGHWRSVPNPLTGTVKEWQVAAAALRYSTTHEYNIVIAGSINASPVYLDSYLQSKFFFFDNCILFMHLDKNSIYYIDFFKCIKHNKGEGSKLLYFAIQYLVKTELEGANLEQTYIILEPNYSISEPGQFAGNSEERKKKLMIFYGKFGFSVISEARAKEKYELTAYEISKPLLENTFSNLILKMAPNKGGYRRRLTKRKTRNRSA